MAQARGTFKTYALNSAAEFPEDEEAIVQASEHMLSLCGNAGQETLIGDLLTNFEEWAAVVLENEEGNEGTTWDSFRTLVLDWYDGRVDKLEGTEQIWAEGWIKIAEQSGYHDARDEYGEGMGQEFQA